MAKLGLKYAAWAKMATEPAAAVPTFDPGLVIGRAVSTNLAVKNIEGELYSDDQLSEYKSEFSSADLTMEVDHITLESQAKVLGATYVDNEMSHSKDDVAPYGGIGGYQVLQVNNTEKYRAWFFPKARASVPDWGGTTKGNSISFGTEPLKLKVLAPNYGPWYRVKEFTTEDAAQGYIDTKLNVATWHAVDVQANGAGEGEGVSPVGGTYVADAGTLAIAITGEPVALYDNGVESVASIVDGVYTLSNITEAHKIAVIF